MAFQLIIWIKGMLLGVLFCDYWVTVADCCLGQVKLCLDYGMGLDFGLELNRSGFLV